MKKLYSSNDPCPYCGRPMSRPTSERLIEPFCAKCLPERMAKANNRKRIPIRVLTTEMLHSGKYV